MKRLNILQAKWSDAIRSQLPAAKGSVTKATSLAARKFPRLRAELLAAANPGKKLRAVDEELPEDEEIEDEDVLDDEDLAEDGLEDAPATRRKSKAKSRSKVKPISKKTAKSAWDLEAARIAARHGFA